MPLPRATDSTSGPMHLPAELGWGLGESHQRLRLATVATASGGRRRAAASCDESPAHGLRRRLGSPAVIEDLINVADFERAAAEKLDAGVLGYFAGGAGDEVTLRDNVAAWRRWRLRPRMLADVERVATGTELLGGELSMPVLVAPVAYQRLVDPEGEVAMARAAAAAGTVMCLSTLATARPSEVAAAAPEGRRWFQLYCFRDEGVTRALMEEAVDSGFEAIVRHRRRAPRRQPRARPAHRLRDPRGSRRAQRRRGARRRAGGDDRRRSSR